ncbi:hypothetical protein HNQ91_001845 [Filimonas zeae]|uniref:Uncharacterized protein n=1 Tax=Filimonas zeae TaxID=1737353 RepID=A0A917IXF8_9BACT|nr:hypothetical protein [Filimonas zeae]MDR6338794.1 hypothetical protein [Filimonas zeae]GGH66581.1 hypothetical protein GCM10011379_20900 [Filimonas zeae]
MKHILLIGALLCTVIASAQQTGALQEKADKYFGINPYSASREGIADLLEEKYHLTDIWRRTRSKDSLFYMRGFTTEFNPFSIPVQSVEFQVREATRSKKRRDGSTIKDTVLVVQVVGLTDTTLQAKKQVEDEWRSIAADFRKSYFVVRENEQREKGELLYANTWFGAETGVFNSVAGFGLHYKDNKTHCVDVMLFFANR